MIFSAAVEDGQKKFLLTLLLLFILITLNYLFCYYDILLNQYNIFAILNVESAKSQTC